MMIVEAITVVMALLVVISFQLGAINNSIKDNR